MATREGSNGAFLQQFSHSIVLLEGKSGSGMSLSAANLAYRLSKHFGKPIRCPSLLGGEFEELGEKEFKKELEAALERGRSNP